MKVRVFSDDNRIDNIDNQYKKLAGVSCTDKSGLDFPPPSPQKNCTIASVWIKNMMINQDTIIIETC